MKHISFNLAFLLSISLGFAQTYIGAGGPFVVSEDTQIPELLVENQDVLNFIKQNLDYPTQARRMGVQGVVTAFLIVNQEGEVEEITITRDVGAGCGDSFIEVLKKTSGEWNFTNKEAEKHTLIIWASFNFYPQDGQSTQRMKSKGLEYYDQGKFKKAIVQFDSFLQDWTSDPEVILKRAESYVKLGKKSQACKDLNLLRIMGELRDFQLLKSTCGY